MLCVEKEIVYFMSEIVLAVCRRVIKGSAELALKSLLKSVAPGKIIIGDRGTWTNKNNEIYKVNR